MNVLMAGSIKLVREEHGQLIVSKVRKLLARMLLPKVVSGEVVSRYVRKAFRVGVWRFLSQECKAILLITRRWGIIKSPTLKSILYRLFLEIELCTLRGRALFYGILLALKSSVYRLHEVLNDYQRLLALGIFYLNSPPMYRHIMLGQVV